MTSWLAWPTSFAQLQHAWTVTLKTRYTSETTPSSDDHCSDAIFSTSESGTISSSQKRTMIIASPLYTVEEKQPPSHGHAATSESRRITGRRMSPIAIVYAMHDPKQKRMMFTSTTSPIFLPKRWTVKSSNERTPDAWIDETRSTTE